MFTIVSRNYIAYAATLMQTVATHHPEAARYVFLADGAYDFADLDIPAAIIPAEDIGIAQFAEMVFRYTIIELNTAVKPSCIKWLFAERKHERVIYLDPDILVLRPLDAVRERLDQGALVVLTPHMTAPLQDGHQPDDLTIMKSGVYNLGFAAFAKSPPVDAFLEWWADRLYKHCRVDIPNHLFTDQRWMDLAPAFIPDAAILRHPGYNLAYWNLLHRPVEERGEGWTADGRPLHFVHFSGVDPLKPHQFSKHQNRFSTENIGGLLPLFETYVARLLANGYAKYIKAPYAYGQFADGRKLHPLMRHYFCRSEENGTALVGASLDTASDIFDEPEPSLSGPGLRDITRVMYQLWLEREDLQKAFRIDTDEGRVSYTEWFAEVAAREEGVDDRTVSAAAALLGRRVDVDPSPATPAPVPWEPDAPWSGPARDVDIYLKGHVPVGPGTHLAAGLPRQMAILWEQRGDLRQAFALADADEIDRYVAWCLTQGVVEKQIVPDLIDDAFWQQLDTPTAMTGIYDEMPVTRGLWMLHSRCDNGEAVARFPEERRGRAEIALWFVVAAARKYNWPPALTRRLREYLHAPVASLSVGRVALPRLALALWEMRPDLHEAYDLSDENGRLGLLWWLLFRGLDEYALTRQDLPQYLWEGLSATDERGALPLIHRLVCLQRPDVAAAFDIRTEPGRAAYFDWFVQYGRGELARHSLFALPSAANGTAPVAPVRPPQPGGPLIALTGCVEAPTGRGEDMRMTMRALDTQGIPYITLDRIDGLVRDQRGNRLDPAVLQSASVNVVHLNADTAYDDHQFLRRHGIGDARLIGYWAWELAQFPAEYLRAFSFYDEIWASTRFAFDAFNTGHRPVTLMPMPVELPDSGTEMDRAYYRLPGGDFLFLFNFDFGSYRSRKNPEAAITAFRRAFPDRRERVRLVIKTINAESHPREWARLQQLAHDDPRIVMRNGGYTREEMINLIRVCDCYVSLHRSEGFGRGPAEAMLLGRPVIVTNYSGNVDFTTAGNSYLVDCRLVPVGAGEYPGGAGQVWAEPDIEHAASHMRRVFEKPGEAKRVGRRARRFMEERYAPRVTGTAYAKRLGELEPRLKPQPHDDGPVRVAALRRIRAASPFEPQDLPAS